MANNVVKHFVIKTWSSYNHDVVKYCNQTWWSNIVIKHGGQTLWSISSVQQASPTRWIHFLHLLLEGKVLAPRGAVGGGDEVGEEESLPVEGLREGGNLLYTPKHWHTIVSLVSKR